jgi:hypothetical protein
MPFRLNEFRTKIQFIAPARMPSLIYKASQALGYPSNTVYIQHAVCEALARDLDLDLGELLAELPPSRGRKGEFRDHRLTGPANTVETVI